PSRRATGPRRAKSDRLDAGRPAVDAVRSGRRDRLAAANLATVVLPLFADRFELGNVLPADDLTPVGHASLRMKSGAAARAAALFGEQRVEGGDGVDLPSTGPAREMGHAGILPP